MSELINDPLYMINSLKSIIWIILPKTDATDTVLEI